MAARSRSRQLRRRMGQSQWRLPILELVATPKTLLRSVIRSTPKRESGAELVWDSRSRAESSRNTLVESVLKARRDKAPRFVSRFQARALEPACRQLATS